jgi:hypothetical protein
MSSAAEGASRGLVGNRAGTCGRPLAEYRQRSFERRIDRVGDLSGSQDAGRSLERAGEWVRKATSSRWPTPAGGSRRQTTGPCLIGGSIASMPHEPEAGPRR